jgi:hypothetical protein
MMRKQYGQTFIIQNRSSMKKILTLIFAIVLCATCQAQEEKLGLNLSKGEIYYHNLISNASITQIVNMRQINMNTTINGKMAFKVIDVQNSIFDMEVRYESLSMKMSLPNGTFEFSSDKNDEGDIFSSVLGAMKNKPFLVKMTKAGKVTEVKNIEALFSNAFVKLPQLTEAQKQQVLTQVAQAYGEKAFKGNLEMVTAIFPDSKVTTGDKWVIKTQLESGMSANMETSYELKEINDSYCLIKGDSKINTADKDAIIQSNGMPLKFDLTGTMSSDIKISRNTGWISESKISQVITGNSQIKDNPNLPGGLIIPMTIKNEMIITDK